MLAPVKKIPLMARGRASAAISEFHPELTAFRRDLHVHPEPGFEEVYTACRIKQALKLCGVDEIHTGIGKTGVVGIIRGKRQIRQHDRAKGGHGRVTVDRVQRLWLEVWSTRLLFTQQPL